MKTVIKEIIKPIKYPCLMRSTIDKQLVLFTSKSIGTLLHKSSHEEAGYHSERWAMNSFVVFTGNITLSN